MKRELFKILYINIIKKHAVDKVTTNKNVKLQKHKKLLIVKWTQYILFHAGEN